MKPIERYWRRCAAAAALLLCACGGLALLPVSAGTGPDPILPTPSQAVIPTVKVARAIGWPPGAEPQAAPGLEVRHFAGGLDHPRWLYVLPNGDVLVAETNAPLKFPHRSGDTHIAEAPEAITDLPAGPINRHWTRSVIASADGRKNYVTAGSNSNAGERAADDVGNCIWRVSAR